MAIKSFKSKAKSSFGISAKDIKDLGPEAAQYQAKTFSSIIKREIKFPTTWLESEIFFIYKGEGNKGKPENYRSLAIQNAILKTFMSLLRHRIVNFAEANNLLPSSRFGFRKGRSTESSAAILHHIVSENINHKRRVYACYIDFKKCFDRLDRAILYKKLQILGIPFQICEILNDIYMGLSAQIRSGDSLYEKFASEIGLPQGCIFSPIAFILFAYDMGCCFSHNGFEFGSTFIRFLMYADDLVIVCKSADELQRAIDELTIYCNQNHLTINQKNSKIMIFGKGKIPKHKEFTLEGQKLEEVNSYNYLGFRFTPQLAFSDHLNMLNKKARARIGLLFNRVPLKNLPLEIVKRIFETYVLPIYRYGSAIWSSKCSKQSIQEADSSQLKFLKRYLGVPSRCNNAITYFLTQCEPLSIKIKQWKQLCSNSLQFPKEFHGVKLNCLTPTSTQKEKDEIGNLESIPTWFWISKQIQRIPRNPSYRRALCEEVFDHKHLNQCSSSAFHHKILDSCTCRICGESMEHYHDRFCHLSTDT